MCPSATEGSRARRDRGRPRSPDRTSIAPQFVLDHRLLEPIDPRANRDRLRLTQPAQLVERRAQPDDVAACFCGRRREFRHRLRRILRGILRCAHFIHARSGRRKRSISVMYRWYLPPSRQMRRVRSIPNCGIQDADGCVELRNQSAWLRCTTSMTGLLTTPRACMGHPTAENCAEVHADHDDHCDRE